jgi:hypothetical protein
MVSFVVWHMTTSTPVTNFFSPLPGIKHHPTTHSIDSPKYFSCFPSCNFTIFIASLVCWTNLFLKAQDNPVELYELGALTQGLDTQKKLAEEAFTIHSRVTQ